MKPLLNFNFNTMTQEYRILQWRETLGWECENDSLGLAQIAL